MASQYKQDLTPLVQVLVSHPLHKSGALTTQTMCFINYRYQLVERLNRDRKYASSLLTGVNCD